MTEARSIISSRDRDCLGCRLVSGSGLIGAGLYILYHARGMTKVAGKSIMFTAGGASMAIGLARIFDFPPFRQKYEVAEN
uniref:Distal membrane-arm assembly complex protein 1-like domain-containing protein n=1 Tax=Trichogramma kaykai TaxID=54128 RepID=A0ABD2XHK9_9HYME